MIAAFARRHLPILDWLGGYRRRNWPGDAMAGVIVAIMLVPQGMAYALLAGLPPQVGLYAGIVPLILYGLLGSSRALAVGPVAIVSLMVASAVGELVVAGHGDAVAIALVLALLSGVILLLMGLARFGFLVNFLSHPVISGFTSAVAMVIGFSQVKHLLGLDIPRGHLITDTIAAVLAQARDINPATVAIGGTAILLLLLSRGPLGQLLARAGLPASIAGSATKAGPLLVVVLGTLAVWGFGLDHETAVGAAVGIVGEIPAGLPSVTAPHFDASLWRAALPAALLISFVGFLESVSVAKSLASKRHQKIDADQELLALGMANVGAAFTGAYPVAGGFGRSVVNFAAGANTQLASLITAMLMGVTVLFLTPLFHFLPKAVLAAIIMVAVFGLLDVQAFGKAWRYNKADAASMLATFGTVLTLGVEIGIVAGAALSIVLYLWRTSRPHMAIIGRVGESEHFRNVERHEVRTWPDILAVRIDESLYFANTAYLEDRLLAEAADRPALRHLVLVFSAVNFVDASALESLEHLIDRMQDYGVIVHLAEVKGPVMDRLERTDLPHRMGGGRIFLSTHQAMDALSGDSRRPNPALAG